MGKCTICRSSNVLDKLRNNQIATCTKVNFADSRTVELAAAIQLYYGGESFQKYNRLCANYYNK